MEIIILDFILNKLCFIQNNHLYSVSLKNTPGINPLVCEWGILYTYSVSSKNAPGINRLLCV